MSLFGQHFVVLDQVDAVIFDAVPVAVSEAGLDQDPAADEALEDVVGVQQGFQSPELEDFWVENTLGLKCR